MGSGLYTPGVPAWITESAAARLATFSNAQGKAGCSNFRAHGCGAIRTATRGFCSLRSRSGRRRTNWQCVVYYLELLALLGNAEYVYTLACLRHHRNGYTVRQAQVIAVTLSPYQKLVDLLGPSAVVPEEQLDDYSIDGVVPQAAVKPADRQAVGEIMRWATQELVPVFPRGGGTQSALGNVPDRSGLAMDLSLQTRVLDYQPADLTATVEAGISLLELQQQLRPGGKFLPLEAPIASRATIGGILAANTSGPLQYSYGQPRDWLIGISIIGAGGVETKAGGKVVKNVTGYDLDKLYTGSLGTLGVIVEATFKLSPLPTAQGTLLAGFSSLEEGVTASAGLLRQVYGPQGVQVVDNRTAQQLDFGASAPPLDRFGSTGAMLLAFFSGRPQAVKRRMADSAAALRESAALDTVNIDDASTPELLQRLTDLGWGWDTRPYLGIKVSAPPSAVASLAERYRQDVSLGLPPGVVVDPGLGIARLLWWTGSAGDWIDDSLLLETIVRTRVMAREAGGFAVVEHCPLPVKKQIDVWGDQPQAMEIMRRIKQKFDPLGILNPGRFLGKI